MLLLMLFIDWNRQITENDRIVMAFVSLSYIQVFFSTEASILLNSTISLGTESRLSPKLVNSMSSGVPVPSLGHLFPTLE